MVLSGVVLPGQCLLLGVTGPSAACVHVCTPPWSGRGTMLIRILPTEAVELVGIRARI